MDADRREVLKQAAALLAGLSLARCAEKKPVQEAVDAATAKTATEKPQPQAYAFQPPQRATIGAACARILPSDKEPGAKEANVIEYIDRELARPEYALLNKAIIAGTVGLDRLSARFGGKKFVDLAAAEQDDIISQVQNASERGEDFIKLLTLLTIEGFASDPKYGGNQNGVGWDFAGYGPGRHEH